MEAVIERLVETLKEPMTAFVLSDPLPIWNPPVESWTEMMTDENVELSKHIRSLAIPARSDEPNCPDMLLHDLGTMTDPGVTRLIETTFAPTKQPCLLINTSGSGKTRAMLEGLTQHWGLYFICSHDGQHGSKDLSYVIDELPDDKNFTSVLPPPGSANFRGLLEQNQTLAAKRFFEVLLSRLIILDLFLEIVSRFGVKEEYKRRKLWLLLQLKPKLGHIPDVFLKATLLLNDLNAPKRNLVRVGKIYTTRIVSQFNLRQLRLPIVLDESQRAAVAYTSSFRSAPGSITNHSAEIDPRPVLRELVAACLSFFTSASTDDQIIPKLIITGTGLRRDTVREAIASSVLKHGNFLSVYIIDSLDDKVKHRRYLQKYLPPKLLESKAFEHLFDRVHHWLRGRYRFTAEYISLLLQDGFRRPHRILGDYIKHAIGCMPTDICATGAINREDRFFDLFPKISVFPFDFKQLERLSDENGPEVEALVRYAYDYLLGSSPPHSFTLREIAFVQYGFARYTHETEVVQVEDTLQPVEGKSNLSSDPKIHVSEPLILLALALWSNRKYNYERPGRWKTRSFLYVLCQSFFGNSSKPEIGNGLENYIAYYLIAVLGKKEGCRLGDIMNFHRKSELADRKAQLAAVHILRDDQAPNGSSILDQVKAPTAADHISQGVITSTILHEEGVDLSHFTGALGRRVERAEQLMEWLLFRHRNAICFPDRNFGPDLMFVLKLLGDEPGTKPTYIWVVVQSKQRLKEPELDKRDLVSCLHTVTPSSFYFDTNGKPYAPKRLPKLPAKVLEAMSFLPDRETELAGKHSLLRVIGAFPAPANLGRIFSVNDDDDDDDDDTSDEDWQRVEAVSPDIQDPDMDNHPLATLSITKMLNVMDEFEPLGKGSAFLRNHTEAMRLSNARVRVKKRAKQDGRKRGGKKEADSGLRRSRRVIKAKQAKQEATKRKEDAKKPTQVGHKRKRTGEEDDHPRKRATRRKS
ncbi:hypothetical protein BDP27DRAFT_1295111 [Rhodocollybia butyracea]|uniref:Uncharacterized protein n=1 Tax=Rhodocollybia butyracea TaxID=206335 RepID=A0A9P5PMB2_9AGAR|nr:hypothetical protein BDP27DRAFT_1295111 [Rhodocollybia butyracea]